MRVRARAMGGAMGVALLIVALPQMLISVVAGGASFGRIPVLAPVLFDTNVYLQWIGVVMAGDLGAAPLAWFAWPLWLIGQVPGITPAEVWVVSATISMAAFFWVCWMYTRRWLPVRWAMGATMLAVAFPMLTLALRPAAYSWYAPCAVAALAAMWPLHEALVDRQWRRACGWSVGAVVAASLYPWYALPMALWVVGLWAYRVVPRCTYRVLALGWAAVAMVVSVGAAIRVPRVVAAPAWVAAWETMERNGITWSHLPVVTNVLLAVLCAGALCLFVAWVFRAHTVAVHRLWVLGAGWIALGAAWFHSVLTGLYTNNDHFRAPAFFLVWASSVVILSVVRKAGVARIQAPPWMPIAVGVIGAFALLQSVARVTTRLGGDYLQQFHIAMWLGVAGVAWLAWGAVRGSVVRGTLYAGAVCVWIVLGGWSYTSALIAEAHATRALAVLQPVIAWARTLPPETTICSTPHLADALATQSGRRVFPSENVAYFRATHAALSDQFVIVLSRVQEVSEEWQAVWGGYRGASCRQFGVADTALRWIGVTGRVRQQLAGCAAEQVATEWQAVQAAAVVPATEALFRASCAVVVTDAGQEALWDVPEGYETLVMGAFVIHRNRTE